MPIHARPKLRLPRPDRRAALAFMPGSDVPVIRQPFGPGDLLPFWAYGVETDHHLLHDLDADPWQTENRAGAAEEKMRSTSCASRSTKSTRPRSSTNASASPDRGFWRHFTTETVADRRQNLREEQVDVAELVPEVALVLGRRVRHVEHRATGDRFEHQQV